MLHSEKEFFFYESFLPKYTPWVDIKKGIKLVKSLPANLCYSRRGGKLWLYSSSLLLEYMVNYVVLVILPIIFIFISINIYIYNSECVVFPLKVSCKAS